MEEITLLDLPQKLQDLRFVNSRSDRTLDLGAVFALKCRLPIGRYGDRVIWALTGNARTPSFQGNLQVFQFVVGRPRYNSTIIKKFIFGVLNRLSQWHRV